MPDIKIKITEPLIEPNNPFANCKFNRQKDAANLTNLIQNYPSGFVLALNNKWGLGKTTFIKMWIQELKNQNFNTIYFNSWENDFESSPLIALISEIKKQLEISNQNKFKKLIKYGALFTKNTLPILIEGIVSKHIGTEKLNLLKKIEDTGLEIFKTEIDLYTERKENLIKFRNELKIQIQENNKFKTPIVFIIDELDRCRPDYAVELLENVKHLFSIEEITFVLSIEKTQLSNSIKGYFGSHDMDSTDYLRRFIDFEYSLPEPSKETYIDYLYDYYQLNQFFSTSEINSRSQIQKNIFDFNKSNLVYLKNLTLRQIEKFFISFKISLHFFDNNSIVFPSLLSFIIYLKIFEPDNFKKLFDRTYTLNELSDLFHDKTHHSISSENEHLLLTTEALLITFYNNYLDSYPKLRLLKLTEGDKYIPIFESKLSEKSTNTKMESILSHIELNHQYNNVNLSYFLDKVNLVGKFQ